MGDLYWVCPTCGEEASDEADRILHLRQTFYDLDHVREQELLYGNDIELFENQNLYS
ncbi:MAG: hypothetical protein ACD_30C00052G0035 [uncultured bacterium]|uniref:C2H2-type domain-containing protein n=2 Tax=Microgenomates group TaxID=1794810 RepID=A0A0G0MM37_9BACT|nr:MAG: hypothetical protein ACD_30C00052G0035 [uncultured bacterium]KKQ14858.1 MAG: hypothetical protein US28_C0028G0022 [Candidatus Daviesbacteria bacterium GW2011_GWA1_36_8]KKQ74764.1 MAG: hypothetical protein US96_C0026G0012 [Candidatus Woesebacteria bacterium GW2011_GWB1_38_5b]